MPHEEERFQNAEDQLSKLPATLRLVGDSLLLFNNRVKVPSATTTWLRTTSRFIHIKAYSRTRNMRRLYTVPRKIIRPTVVVCPERSARYFS
jgi:hypothetical protein